jgi:hypothetical protein
LPSRHIGADSTRSLRALHAHRGGEIAPDDADTITRPDRGRSLWPNFDLSTADYLQVLEWTGRMLAPGKRGRIAKHSPAI